MTDGEKTLPKCVWKEVVSAQNGKTYYYDEETRQSVLEEPEELRVHKARIAAQSAGLVSSAAASNGGTGGGIGSAQAPASK
jgi:hypothetical protein